MKHPCGDDDTLGALTEHRTPSRALRSRLFQLAAAVLIPTVAKAVLAVWASYAREQRLLERSMSETSRALVMVVDRELAMLEAAAWALSQLDELSRSDLARFHAQASAATARAGAWVVVTEHPVAPALPRQVANTSRPFGTPLPLVRELGSFDPWTDRAAVVSDLFVGPITQRWVTAVTVPSTRMRGDARLAVSVSTGPERFQSVIEAQGFPDGWYAAVLDRSGTVVARTPNGQQWVGRKASPAILEQLAGGRGGRVETTTLEGVPVDAFLARSPASGWAFVVAVPDSVMQAGLMQSVGWVTVVAVAFCALAGLIAWRAATRIGASVAGVARVADHLVQGRPARYRPTGLAELDGIGRTLEHANLRILDARRELETQVREAVQRAEHAHSRAASAQRMESLSKLAGGFAHDVNNLLGIIGNSAYVLARRLQDGELARPVDAIRRAVESGRDLTQRLLGLSGRRPLAERVLVPEQWLPGAVDTVRATLPPTVEVVLRIAPDTPAVKTDPTELQLALLHLMTNSSEATSGEGRIEVAARPLPAAMSALAVPSVVVEVTDDGVGIEASHRDRVFEPFFSTKHASAGAGLGLTQVYMFMERTGGRVALRSRPGEGTTVSLVFASAGGAATTPTAPEADAERSTLDARVLYVEDNGELAASMSPVLEALGCTVTHASDASAARRLVAREAFDVVLSDIVMPGTESGLAFARWLKEHRAGVPVVLMTGYSQESEAALGQGFEVLEKPCSPEVVAAAIARRLVKSG
jgi:signal transduction histidine kinase